jgi:hypothetical protein
VLCCVALLCVGWEEGGAVEGGALLCYAVLCCAVQCSAVPCSADTRIHASQRGISHVATKRRSEAVKGSSVCETCISRYAPQYSIVYYCAGPYKSAVPRRRAAQNQPTTA